MIDECLHESWECSGPTGHGVTGICHSCSDCDIVWTDSWTKFEFCEVCDPTNNSTDSLSASNGFVTKDSGKREEYGSGMVRDTQDGKPRYDLLLPKDVPYSDQFLTRVAGLLARGAEKYSDRNWEQASGTEELDRFKSSAFRHLMQWLTDETDEDHGAAVVFNILAFETVKWKMENGQ